MEKNAHALSIPLSRPPQSPLINLKIRGKSISYRHLEKEKEKEDLKIHINQTKRFFFLRHGITEALP